MNIALARIVNDTLEQQAIADGVRRRGYAHELRRHDSGLSLRISRSKAHVGQHDRRAAGDSLHQGRARALAAVHLQRHARRAAQRNSRAPVRSERHRAQQSDVPAPCRPRRLLLGAQRLHGFFHVARLAKFSRPARSGDPGWTKLNGDWNYTWLDRFVAGRIGASYLVQQDGLHNLALSWTHNQEITPDQHLRGERQLRHEHRTLQRQNTFNPYTALATIASSATYTGQIGTSVVVDWRDAHAVSGAHSGRSDVPHAHTHHDANRPWLGVELDAELERESQRRVEHRPAGVGVPGVLSESAHRSNGQHAVEIAQFVDVVDLVRHAAADFRLGFQERVPGHPAAREPPAAVYDLRRQHRRGDRYARVRRDVQHQRRLDAAVCAAAVLPQPVQPFAHRRAEQRRSRPVLGRVGTNGRTFRSSVEAHYRRCVGVSHDLRTVPRIWTVHATPPNSVADDRLFVGAGEQRQQRLPHRARPHAQRLPGQPAAEFDHLRPDAGHSSQDSPSERFKPGRRQADRPPWHHLRLAELRLRARKGVRENERSRWIVRHHDRFVELQSKVGSAARLRLFVQLLALPGQHAERHGEVQPVSHGHIGELHDWARPESVRRAVSPVRQGRSLADGNRRPAGDQLRSAPVDTQAAALRRAAGGRVGADWQSIPAPARQGMARRVQSHAIESAAADWDQRHRLRSAASAASKSSEPTPTRSCSISAWRRCVRSRPRIFRCRRPRRAAPRTTFRRRCR